ncbi:MAG: hypothetical protein M3536_00120 [Actinomycetota bacterium]|nr:hypothetical protein [Actinomycetota bacterium]
MARDRANINTNIWTDQDWRNLPIAQQHLYLLLTSHPTLSYAGVVDWREARLAAMTADATPESIRGAAEGLQSERFVFIDDETEEILVRSFLRHDGLLKQPKLSISMVNAFGAIASARIREVVTFELQKLYREHGDWAAFSQEKVLALVKGKGTDMAEFTLGFTPSFTPAFTLNAAQADPLPTTTATTTATEDKSSTRPADAEAEFAQWYSAYPRKIDKGHARTAFKAARKKTDLDTLVKAAEQFALHSRGTEPKFLAYPATWLNGERWEDEAPQQSVIAGPWSEDFHKKGLRA